MREKDEALPFHFSNEVIVGLYDEVSSLLCLDQDLKSGEKSLKGKNIIWGFTEPQWLNQTRCQCFARSHPTADLHDCSKECSSHCRGSTGRTTSERKTSLNWYYSLFNEHSTEIHPRSFVRLSLTRRLLALTSCKARLGVVHWRLDRREIFSISSFFSLIPWTRSIDQETHFWTMKRKEREREREREKRYLQIIDQVSSSFIPRIEWRQLFFVLWHCVDEFVLVRPRSATNGELRGILIVCLSTLLFITMKLVLRLGKKLVSDENVNGREMSRESQRLKQLIPGKFLVDWTLSPQAITRQRTKLIDNLSCTRSDFKMKKRERERKCFSSIINRRMFYPSSNRRMASSFEMD